MKDFESYFTKMRSTLNLLMRYRTYLDAAAV